MSIELYKFKNPQRKKTYKEYLDSIFKNVYYGTNEIPLIMSFRALLNCPFVPYKLDIPYVEALRTFINMIKCQCIFNQYNFADIPFVNKKTKRLSDPFIVNILKWSPSRSLNFRMNKRERELMKRKVYKTKAWTCADKALYQIYLSSKPQQKKYNLFLDYLKPFKIVVEKFKVSKQVDEVIMHINGEQILKHLRRDKLNTPMSKNNIENITKNKFFYKNIIE